MLYVYTFNDGGRKEEQREAGLGEGPCRLSSTYLGSRGLGSTGKLLQLSVKENKYLTSLDQAMMQLKYLKTV